MEGQAHHHAQAGHFDRALELYANALPAQADQLARLARSLDTTPVALREEYRRVTRKAREVFERVFFAAGTP